MKVDIDVNQVIANVVEHSCKNIIEDISKTVKINKKDFTNKFSIKYNKAFKEYLKKAYNKYSKIKTLLYKTEPKYLYDFFECNNLKYDDKQIDPIDINNILNISNFLIIKGTGGIGKSTLMKHLFLNELEKNDLIPIFFELKDLNSSEESLEDCIYNSINKLGCEFERQYFEYAMKSGKFLVLLDGYDEISSTRLEKFPKELEEMTDKYENNCYIMSSRPSENFISFQRFTVLESQPFTKEKTINLIKKIDYDEEIKQRFIKELCINLYDKHQSFASNPLLLTIMLLTYNDYAEIPDKLHLFYEQAFETLYLKHDATKSGYRREMQSKLTRNIFEKAFSKFCFKTYVREKFEFSKIELNQFFDEVKDDNINFENEKFLQDLISSVCLMYLDGKVYSFTHRSFQEYFTAKYILSLSDENQQKVCRKLINYREHDNVLDMLYDMSKERFENNVLIPYLEEIEEKCKGKDRYTEYYKELLCNMQIRITKESHIGIGISYRIKDIFLYTIERKYMNNKHKLYTAKRNKEKEKQQIIERMNGKEYAIIPIEEAINDEIYSKELKNSPIEAKVLNLMSLLEELKSNQNKLEEELDFILNE